MLRYFFLLALSFTVATSFQLLIYREINFRGLIYEEESEAEGCRNLKPFAQGNAGSVRVDQCIMIFETTNCGGNSQRLEPSGENLRNLMKPISSYFLCNDTHGGQNIRVDFFDQRGNTLAEYKNVCACQDLPSEVSSNALSLFNFGNCVRIFQTDTCGGKSDEIQGGVNAHSKDLTLFDYFPRSIKACGACGRLTSRIYKFVLNFDDNFSEKQVELAAKTTFYNNGSATVTQEYQASRTVRQSYTVTRSKTISKMNSRYVEANASAAIGAGKDLPFTASLEAHAAIQLTNAYSESSSDEESWTNEEEKTFAVTQTIQIPPCVQYEVSSTVSIAENVPIRYELFTKITGESGGRRLTALEIQGLVYDMKYIENLDEFTAVYSTEHELVASVGVDTFISGEGSNIEGCEVNGNIKSEL